MRIPGFWITAETLAWSPDVAFSHSLKKDQPQHLQRNSLPCSDGNDTVIVLNRALDLNLIRSLGTLRKALLNVQSRMCRKQYAKSDKGNSLLETLLCAYVSSYTALFSTTDEENRVYTYNQEVRKKNSKQCSALLPLIIVTVQYNLMRNSDSYLFILPVLFSIVCTFCKCMRFVLSCSCYI